MSPPVVGAKKPFRVNRTDAKVSLPAQHSTKHLRRTITPEIAARWLETSIGSREISLTKMNEYGADMTAGRWNPETSPIQFTESGKLFNGHHRLWACLLHSVTFDNVVTMGGTEETHETADSGVLRQKGHVLQIEGYKDGHQLASLAMNIIAYQKRILWRTDYRRYVTKAEIVAFVKGHYDAIAAANTMSQKTRHICPRTVVGTTYYVCRATKHGAYADSFFHRLADGAELKKGDPIYRVREQLLRMKNSIGRFPANLSIAVVIKAWNAHIAGEKDVRAFAWRTSGVAPEAFPIAK